MKKWKKIIALTGILIMAVAGYGWYLYNQKPADVRKLTADMELSAANLAQQFKENEMLACNRYIEKILIVSGKVTSVELNDMGQAMVSLETSDPLCSVVCSFYSEETGTVKQLTTGTTVRIKGNCTGMLADVILNKCSIIP